VRQRRRIGEAGGLQGNCFALQDSCNWLFSLCIPLCSSRFWIYLCSIG
jgi:hypothetical protein